MENTEVIETTGTEAIEKEEADEIPTVEDPRKGLVPMIRRDAESGDGVVSLVPSSGNDVIVMANTPGGLEQGQAALLEWADRKIASLERELGHAQANLAEAKESKIRTAPWTREVKRWQKHIIYYSKIRAALLDGYFIVPDFPINVIAVRTKKTRPTDAGRVHRYISSVKSEEPQGLAIGAGDYVNPDPSAWTSTVEVDSTNYKGEPTKNKENRFTTCQTFNEIDFPLRLVRPQILRDFRKSVEKKLFDEIGVLPDTRRRNPDPMIVGRISMKDGSRRRSVSFLISWWIPTQSL